MERKIYINIIINDIRTIKMNIIITIRKQWWKKIRYWFSNVLGKLVSSLFDSNAYSFFFSTSSLFFVSFFLSNVLQRIFKTRSNLNSFLVKFHSKLRPFCTFLLRQNIPGFDSMRKKCREEFEDRNVWIDHLVDFFWVKHSLPSSWNHFLFGIWHSLIFCKYKKRKKNWGSIRKMEFRSKSRIRRRLRFREHSRQTFYEYHKVWEDLRRAGGVAEGSRGREAEKC